LGKRAATASSATQAIDGNGGGPGRTRTCNQIVMSDRL
jgi:hypothetical protein